MQRKTIKWRRPTANQDNVKHCNQTESLVLLENWSDKCLSFHCTDLYFISYTDQWITGIFQRMQQKENQNEL